MSDTYTSALRAQPRLLAVALPALVLLWWWLWEHADLHLQSHSLVAAASLWFIMMVDHRPNNTDLAITFTHCYQPTKAV